MRFIKRFGEPRPDKPQASALKDFWLPLAPTVVAIVALLSQAIISYQNSQQELKLKQYEVSFKLKQEGYAELMQSMQDAWESTNTEQGTKQMKRADLAFFGLEPFLKYDTTQEVSSLLAKIRTYTTTGYPKVSANYDYYLSRNRIHDLLIVGLFQ
jgi:hypothetical protein